MAWYLKTTEKVWVIVERSSRHSCFALSFVQCSRCHRFANSWPYRTPTSGPTAAHIVKMIVDQTKKYIVSLLPLTIRDAIVRFTSPLVATGEIPAPMVDY